MSRWRLAGVAIVIAASMLHAQAPAGSAVITGVVRDESGQPIEGARVSAATRAKRWNGPYRATAIGRSDETDDRGMFRLHSLPGGDFVVSVMPARPSGRAYVAYYPSTADMPDAGVVTVESGKEVDVSIVVKPVQEVPISGVVRGPNGAPAASMDVVLVPEQSHEHFWTGREVFTTRTNADGAFTVGARPGRYTLAVRRLNAARPQESAEQELTVSSEPITGLAITTSFDGTVVSGRLVWEGTGPQPWPRQTSLGGIRAARVNTTYPLYDVRDFQVSGDGTFRFEGLHGLLRFQEFLLGWRIVRVEGPSAVAASRRLELSPGTPVSDVRIVVSNRLGALVSSIRDGDQPAGKANVFILPESPTADTPNAMGFVEVTSPGATVTGLLEGTYLVVAADVSGGPLQQDTILMERARAAATRVPVQAGALTRATVPLTRLHETAERLCACRIER